MAIKSKGCRNNRNGFAIILLYSLLVIISLPLVFAIPDSLTLQGKLTNLGGAAQVGAINFSFKIYDIREMLKEGCFLYQKALLKRK